MNLIKEFSHLLIFLAWITGAFSIIRLLAAGEKKRLGGSVITVLLEDLREAPIPAALGYLFWFISSWVGVVVYFFTETKKEEK